jgi:hypothetical protein
MSLRPDWPTEQDPLSKEKRVTVLYSKEKKKMNVPVGGNAGCRIKYNDQFNLKSDISFSKKS